MGSFMGSARCGVASGGGFHSVFGGPGGDASTPPLLDLSEFPSLGRSGQGDQVHQPAAAGVKPYGETCNTIFILIYYFFILCK